MTTKDNLELWHKVEKTNPKYTKEAKVGGINITAIAPQYQIMMVTEQFGIYGEKWGFKNIELNYSLIEKYNMVVFKGTFFFPGGEFEIINSCKLYMDRALTMVDDNFAKKIETDALTKAISKLGFNADIFMGKFDDVRYVEEMKKEFADPPIDYKSKLEEATTVKQLGEIWQSIPADIKPNHLSTKDEMKKILEQVEIIGTIKTNIAFEAYVKEFEQGEFKDNAKLKALLEKMKLKFKVD